jgi:hypothetical protein
VQRYMLFLFLQSFSEKKSNIFILKGLFSLFEVIYSCIKPY